MRIYVGEEVINLNFDVTTITDAVTTSIANLVSFIPQFLAGLIVLLIGLVLSALLKDVVISFFRFLGLEKWLDNFSKWFEKLKGEKKPGAAVWINLLGELVRWTVVILFLIPAAETWGLPKVTDVLNQILLYLPNVFVAVIVGFVGLAISNLVYEIARNAVSEMGSSSSKLLANIGRYGVIFFTALVVLNQLGVASDLIRILFTGIVAMLALAGGLAFGLGGQESAKIALREFLSRLSEVEVTSKKAR